MPSQPLGMFAWFGYRLPLEQRVGLIAQAGFSTTCLWFGEDEELVAGNMADRMPDMARDAGLSVDNLHAPFEGCNALWSDTKSAISAASHPYVLVARAEELGVILAVENTRSPLHIDFLLSSIESRHLALCYDSSHDFISGHPPCALLRKWGYRLVTTHLSDNNGVTDDHYLPGDGRIDWDIIQDAFPKTQYSGALMLEVVPQTGEVPAPEQFTRMAYSRALDQRSKIGLRGPADDAPPRA
ncbi:MAG: sugar phosphate isomerase/epimerase [Candidatus Eisenbacteria bacterium]|uniref:Sugar phosphate isomerase/epimerase n=1 Tax=Eiseniibacteriota bacterium TaxID=2212470 RepID=A0A948RXF7_UNCEI|nr:sugar phosphate isomerase/epimerase [Candidatus Eisenbacteria bacterium]MBU1947982.1 sugar phosphate isomerase/epimerase [Candidatus Eisenbacteria bacterium]MBU2692271.1 sugar phosphate isomerase/epimerase [Candidatus Eisenbacteria bacterium]